MIVIDESLEGNIVNIIVEIKSRLGENKIKAETINEILKDTLELVEKLDIKGDEKREIAIKVIKHLVDDLVDDNDEKKLINDMIDKKILSNTIDLIILGSKGKLNINNPEIQKRLLSFGKDILPLFLKFIDIITNCFKNNKNSNTEKVDESSNSNVKIEKKELKIEVEVEDKD